MSGTLQPSIVDRALGAFGLARKAAPAPAVLYPAMGSGVPTYPMTFPGWPDRQPPGVGQARTDEARARTAVTSSWVYSCIQALANEFSTSTLLIKEYTTEEDGTQQWTDNEQEDHPLEQLWSAPNPYMGRAFVTSYWVWQLLLTGEAYLFFAPDGTGLAEIWPVPSFLMEPIADDKAFISGYLFKVPPKNGVPQKPIKIDPQYICYSRLPHPFDPRRGLAPLVACFLTAETDLAQLGWNRNFFSKENAIPAGMAILPKDMNEPSYQVARSEIFDFFGGGRRRIAVVRAGDLDFKMLQNSAKDMEFISGRTFNRDEIGRVFGFPDGYWAASATEANARGAKAIVIEQAVWPRLVMLAEDLNAQIVRAWYGDGYRAEFKDIRPRNRELDLREFTTHSAVLTVDELREIIGKPTIGDVRGKMLLVEIQKQAATPTSEPSMEIEEALGAMEAALPPPDEAQGAAPVGDEAPAEDMPQPETEDVTEVKEANLRAATMLREWRTDAVRDAGLRQWERKALRRLKDGKRPACDFQSEAIPPTLTSSIKAALTLAQTPDDVRAAFKAKGRAQPTIDDATVERARRLVEQVRRGED